jgi:CubicO group peptidase (beta-lactamase class C family)
VHLLRASSAPALRFGDADAVVRETLGSRYTAAVLRVERAGRALFERAYGAVDDAGGAPISVATSFDLASLTKPIVTAAVLRSLAAGALALDDSLVSLLPEWRRLPQEAISLRMLLAHVSGMQSGADYRTLLDEAITYYALMRPLVAAPLERVVYSDLGFIAVGVLLERAMRRSLRELLAQLAAHAGAPTLRYRPSERDRAAIPATEDDGWRGRVRGVVHDEKAFLMNGVAAHAGLFGSAYDVARITDAFLAPLCGRAGELLDAGYAREAVREQAADPLLRRGLGWALKTSDENSCGRAMSASTFGHTGFTGTSVWADPQRDVQIVFLTNAVYFGRTDLRGVRAAVYDAVMEELDRC